MLRETAAIACLDGETLQLKTERGAACAGCSLKVGCGQYLLMSDAELLKVRDCEVARPLLQEGLQVGDHVQISLSEGQLLQLAALFYGLPLCGLLLFTLLASLLEAGEGALILAALTGLATGVLLSRLLMSSASIRRSVSPKIHRMAAAGANETLAHGST